MNFNTDGFNERTNYIHNQNDMNTLKKIKNKGFDNSFAKMRVQENRPLINTASHESVVNLKQTCSNKDNFILRNKNIMNENLNMNSFKNNNVKFK